ncbi:MAG: ABC transporter permease [Sorangiineae bacterium NIC37A_2]|jgi:phospholipid/cholesterol/gamma-HCH transport system permease protein|nr:MAG: ABC transporter permease [Sorangiineae bacterium NIC37A_2]
MRELLRFFGDFLQGLGGLGVVLATTFDGTLRGKVDGRQLRDSLLRLGVGSIPVIVATALFVGGIMVVQSAPLITRFGAHGLLGWGAGFGILREVGPVLTGLMISGRAGSNNTAELGTLTVTEQVDGLRAIAVDPGPYLVAPRVLAIVLTTVLGTLLSMAVALLGAALSGFGLLGVHPVTFWNGLVSGLIGPEDVLHGALKALIFGIIIGATSTSFGLHARGGAPGVGRAVNQSVVLSALMIFVFDALVSFAAEALAP